MSFTHPKSLLNQPFAIAPTDNLPPWHSLEVEQIIKLLESNRAQGLSTAQVEAKKARFGANKLIAKQGKPW